MRLIHTERTFLNMAGKYSSQTVRLVAHMDGAVDEEMLKEAVDATRRRYPYLCVRLCIVLDAQGAERYAYEDNPLPWVLTRGQLATCPAGRGERRRRYVLYQFHPAVRYRRLSRRLSQRTGPDGTQL